MIQRSFKISLLSLVLFASFSGAQENKAKIRETNYREKEWIKQFENAESEDVPGIVESFKSQSSLFEVDHPDVVEAMLNFDKKYPSSDRIALYLQSNFAKYSWIENHPLNKKLFDRMTEILGESEASASANDRKYWAIMGMKHGGFPGLRYLEDFMKNKKNSEELRKLAISELASYKRNGMNILRRESEDAEFNILPTIGRTITNYRTIHMDQYSPGASDLSDQEYIDLMKTVLERMKNAVKQASKAQENGEEIWKLREEIQRLEYHLNSFVKETGKGFSNENSAPLHKAPAKDLPRQPQ